MEVVAAREHVEGPQCESVHTVSAPRILGNDFETMKERPVMLKRNQDVRRDLLGARTVT